MNENPTICVVGLVAGVLGLIVSIAALWRWKAKSRDSLFIGDPHYDSKSDLYRLMVRNESKGTLQVLAKLVAVVDEEGRPHVDSARLPIKLQWMHWPNCHVLSVTWIEKLDVAFCRRMQLTPELQVAGVAFDGFTIAFHDDLLTAYLCIEFYNALTNKRIATEWCAFTSSDAYESGYHVRLEEPPHKEASNG